MPCATRCNHEALLLRDGDERVQRCVWQAEAREGDARQERRAAERLAAQAARAMVRRLRQRTRTLAFASRAIDHTAVLFWGLLRARTGRGCAWGMRLVTVEDVQVPPQTAIGHLMSAFDLLLRHERGEGRVDVGDEEARRSLTQKLTDRLRAGAGKAKEHANALMEFYLTGVHRVRMLCI